MYLHIRIFFYQKSKVAENLEMEPNQAPSAVPSLSFYNNNYPNYAGYGLPHPHAYYGYPGKRVNLIFVFKISGFISIILGWTPPSPILSASAPSSVPASMMLSPLWFGGPPPIPLATSTPLNPAFMCSTSSQIDTSMMDAQKEANGELSVSDGDMQSLTEGMGDTTAVVNTNMDLR
jgi:hypothetical protein